MSKTTQFSKDEVPQGEVLQGWLSDVTDKNTYKEYKAGGAEFRPWFRPAVIVSKERRFPSVTPSCDLSKDFPMKAEEQRPLKSCAACAVVGLVEYFQKRAKYANLIEVSKLFLYQVSRLEMGLDLIDEGAAIGATIRALIKYGVPPEDQWKYPPERDNALQKLSAAPTQHQDLLDSALQYKNQYIPELASFRIDPPEGFTLQSDLLTYLKRYMLIGFPLVFGFRTYEQCLLQAYETGTGDIPFPSAQELSASGREIPSQGHAVIAVGYDDSKEVQNQSTGETTVGAIKIRNSFGENWGNGGYGYLPYQYIQQELTKDWWTLIQRSWVEGAGLELSEADAELFGEQQPPFPTGP